jgi:hypothetical protein
MTCMGFERGVLKERGYKKIKVLLKAYFFNHSNTT